MKRTQHPCTQGLVAALAATLCTSAFAAPTVYSFSGVIDVNHSDKAGLATFTGQFSFDRFKPDAAPSDDHEGYYPMGNGPYGMSVLFDNGVAFVVDPNPHYAMSVHVALPTAVGQTPDYGRFDVAGTVLGETDRFISLDFRDAFATDALPWPAGGFDLSSFDASLFSYHGLATPAPLPGEVVPPPFGASGHLTALACIASCGALEIPEPEPYALMLPGLGVALIGRRRLRGTPRASTRPAGASPIPRFLQRPSVCLSLFALLAAMVASDAQAQASEASALSMLPIAMVSAAPASLVSAGATLTVVAVEASVDGAVWILERASDGARATLKVAGKASVAVGTSVAVTAMATGYVLSAAGQAIACIPNAVGASLLYNERVTR